jgi:hypothetical protein
MCSKRIEIYRDEDQPEAFLDRVRVARQALKPSIEILRSYPKGSKLVALAGFAPNS